MKSREFNEADPCFPNGVYNGITNEGFIKCTCGKDNKYCSDDFTKNIESYGVKCLMIFCDFTEKNSVKLLFNEFDKEFMRQI